jgi:hypothetical protein
MITLEQAQQYLVSVGIVAPDFIVQLWVDRVNTIQPCFEEHYDPATALLIQMYLIGLMGVVAGDRYVTSQTAPKTGASQSYRYGTLTERYRANLSLLNNLDPFGCSGPLVPAEPGASAGMWLGRGGCDCV